MGGIIFSLAIAYFSYKQPEKYMKEPTKKNKAWCLVLGALNTILVIQAIRGLDSFELGSFLGLFVVALIILYGWLAFRNFIVIKDAILPKEGVDEPSSHEVESATSHPFPVINKGSADATVPNVRGENLKAPVINKESVDALLADAKNKDFTYWITPGSAVLVILVTLQKWIHLKMLDDVNDIFSLFTDASSKRLETKYSLFQFSKLLNNINRYAYSEDMEIMSVVFKIAAILIIAVQAFLIYNYIKKSNTTKKIAGIAAVVTCLVSIAFILIVYAANSAVAEETYGIVNTSVKATVMPYLAILFSIIAKMNVKRLSSGIGSEGSGEDETVPSDI